MLEIILLIVGIFKAFRRPKLKRLKAENFPDVDAEKFTMWQKAELKATDIFLWATWGALGIKIIIRIALSGQSFSQQEAITIMLIILAGWFIGLIIAATFGSKAKKLRLAAGITWPKK
jgi:fucose permease